MSNFSNKIQNVLDGKEILQHTGISKKKELVKYDDNILHQYDNYTYHIQWFMINTAKLKSIEKEEEYNTTNKFLNNISESDKIILVETGVTPEYNIRNLTLTSYPKPMVNGFCSATTGASMTLEELAGCQFCNQLTLVRKLLGYKTMYCPMFIDIWFSGYENSTGTPVKNIIGRKRLKMVITNIKSDIGLDKTTYSIDLVSVEMVGLNKNLLQMNDIPQIELSKNDTLEQLRSRLEETLNNRYWETSKNIENFFKKVGGKKFNINFMNIDETKFDPKKYIPVSNLTPDSSGTDDGLFFKLDNTAGLDRFFQKICGCFEGLKTSCADVRITPKYAGIVDNKNEWIIDIDVYFYKNPFIEWQDENKDITDVSVLSKTAESMQLKYIAFLRETNRLNKKYNYGVRSANIDVLNLKTKIDNLYYANIWNVDLSQANEDSTNIFSMLESLISSATEAKEEKLDLGDVLSDKADVSAIGKKYYMSDIWNCMDKKSRDNLLLRDVPLCWDSMSENNSTEQASNNSKQGLSGPITNLAGFSALHLAGNMLEIKMDIVGDPYWLDLHAYMPKNLKNSLFKNTSISNQSLTSFYFNMKAFQKLNINENNVLDYTMDDFNDLSGIYSIIEINSVFNEGKFTQTITGVMDVAMLIPSKCKSANKTSTPMNWVNTVSKVASVVKTIF